MAVKRDQSTGEYLGLACDTCGTMAPDSATIIAGFGLIKMGWYCSGGTHICPDCPHPPVVAKPGVALARTEAGS